MGVMMVYSITLGNPPVSGFNQNLTVTTLVADDDVWSLSPAKYASILCVPGSR